MKKRMLIIAGVFIAVLVAGSVIYTKISQDPNYVIRHSALRIREGSIKKASYDCGHLIAVTDKRTPVYMFRPAEDGQYTFNITDIQSETGDMLVMSVVDRKFSDYLTAGNHSDEGELLDSISESTFLQKGRRYYVFIDPAGDSGGRHKGSFRIGISRSEADDKPAEILAGGKAKLKVETGEQASLLFVPEESGFYRFNSDIISKNATSGFSSVSDVTAGSNEETIPVSDGICRLEAGIEYYIQVSVEDINGKSADVELSCSKIDTAEFDVNGTAELDSRSMIEYTADKTGRIIIHSESDGNPKAAVYDSEGMPLRKDDDSGGEFGGNRKDFAVMIDAIEGEKYHIYVYGRFDKCKVVVEVVR